MTVVYGARCAWWDTIDKAASAAPAADACEYCGRKHLFGVPLACQRGERTPYHGSPCCPECGGALLEVEHEEIWWGNVAAVPVLRWTRGRCFPTLEALEAAFAVEQMEATG